jgi:zinc transporter, ZIP family
MVTAFVFGILGSSALVVGGAIGAWWDAPRRLTGIFLAFASGTLISALAFELFPDAVEMAGLATASAGLVVGALVFVVVNLRLDAATLVHAGEADELPMREALSADTSEALSPATADQREKVEELAHGSGGGLTSGVGLALLAAVVLDGIPENLALGVSLVGEAEGSANLALLVAIFASNLPESLVGGIAMRAGGRSRRFVVTIWAAAAVALTLAVVVGRAMVSGVGDGVVGFSLAFAGGAVLASLADTLMPEAFEHGRPLNALATAVGFLLSFVLASG